VYNASSRSNNFKRAKGVDKMDETTTYGQPHLTKSISSQVGLHFQSTN